MSVPNLKWVPGHTQLGIILWSVRCVRMRGRDSSIRSKVIRGSQILEIGSRDVLRIDLFVQKL